MDRTITGQKREKSWLRRPLPVGHLLPGPGQRSVHRPLGLGAAQDMQVVSGALTGPWQPGVYHLVTRAVLRAYCAGRTPAGASFGLLYPAGRAEAQLLQVSEEVAAVCRDVSLPVLGMDVTVSPAVSEPVLSVSLTEEEVSSRERGLPDPIGTSLPLVMAGTAGNAGCAILTRAAREALEQRYPPGFLDRAAGLDAWPFMGDPKALAEMVRCQVWCVPIGAGGVFGALWQLAEELSCALMCSLRQIPIHQECIEICEFFDLDPYQLYGGGALMVCRDAKEVLDRLGAWGIGAAQIGQVCPGKQRLIRNGEEIRYLDKPRQDMLDGLWERMCLQQKGQ